MTDVLMDTGPLVAMINRGDTYHRDCVALIRSLGGPFYTTLQVMTEAMYLADSRLGWPAQEALWKMVLRGDLLFEPTSPQELSRMAGLMAKFRDHPMDFADASLVALAERLGYDRICTLDVKDFSSYRMEGNRPFVVLCPRVV